MSKKKGRSRHHHRPPWWPEDTSWWSHKEGEGGEHGPPLPPWRTKHGKDRPRHSPRDLHSEWSPSDRRLFFRFAVAFGLFVLLACVAILALGAAAFLVFQPDRLPRPDPGTHPFRGIALLLGLGFLLLLALRRVGTLTARRYTAPLSETMKAADALAEGDLSARVPVQGSGEFRHFARSFNHMAAALETADRQRRELLADVAHELRTPLTIIQGNLEGLRDGVYQATPEHLDLVLDETQSLSRLVDDLRLLTLAEAGQLPLDRQDLDVRQLLADVCDAFAHNADEAGIHLALEGEHDLPRLRADSQRIGQVLGNLVANALRHTPPGGRVRLGAEPSPDGQAIRLWVADTGEGIPAEDLPRIFDRFWRGDPARSHDAGAGTGLGLAIARGLIEAHGGRIMADSQIGEGTEVSCILPLPPATSPSTG